MSWDLDSLISEDDIIFEQSLLKDPYKSSLWLEYYESNELESIYKKVFILSRAVTFIPNDIQLWSMYLDLRVSAAITTGTSLRSLRAINSLFTKALSHVESIELWLKYLQFLLDTQISSITFIRRQFNACLAATPINQHNSIWHLYLNFASIVKGITAVKIYKNFLKFITPAELASSSEFEISLYEVIINLIKFGGVSESMDIFKVITKNPENFTQLEISQFQLWIDVLGELVDDGGTQVEDSLIDELVAVGLKKFPDQISKFYLKQADFYEKKQLYSKVRFLLNRGLTECVTVNDFVLIFEAFTEFEERVIEKLIEAGEETESVISLRMAFLEELLENRSIYLSNMMIKQDPNNLDEWFNRISIYESKNDINKVLNTFAEALTTINPLKSHSLSSNTSNTLPKLWISYSNVYASNGDYKTASIILSKSIQSQFQTPDELVELYLEWSQLELKRGEDESAVKVVEDVCLYIPTKTSSTNKNDEVSYTDSSIDIHTRLHKSSKLWNYYLDLLESFTEDGTPIEIDRVSRAYDKLILLKLITPLNIINYASFLEEWKFYEKSFGIYELGTKIFQFPVSFEIWNIYLVKVMQSKKDSPETVRDLFEQCISECPANLSKPILVLYSNFEEENGLILKSIKILKQGIKKMVSSTDPKVIDAKCDLYAMLLIKLTNLKDTQTIRETYETLLEDENLTPFRLLEFATKFIDFEISEGEFVRVRLLFKYVVDFKPPTELASIWEKWEIFELEKGNENTYKDMLRVRRVVNDKYEQRNSVLTGFVKAKTPNPLKSKLVQPQSEEVNVGTENPDEIEIDMD